MKIFIADDSAILRERLASALSEIAGVQVVGEAGDAKEAAEAILRVVPDLVVLDIQMPGGSGIEVLRELKQARPSIRVIIFTNHYSRQYQKRCLALKADYFLPKVVALGELIELVSDLSLSFQWPNLESPLPS
jgi:DNA-binding NarL/FixJ family response regulator